jgi:dihydrofolate synthase / folylpolyglutamate synthase
MRAEDYLYSLFDFEKEKSTRRKAKPFTLERVSQTINHFNLNDLNGKIIHIAGTKGKGSTLLYIDHVLKNYHGKKKIGLYTSPHLISLHERIQVDGVNIPDKKLLSLAKKITIESEKFLDDKLSFFEMMLVIAMAYFVEQDVSVVLLETGLGGRLDATNAIQSDLTLLSKIDYDHCEILGDTLEKIAYEKAGIIKSAPVIALHQEKVVNDVFEHRAKEQGVLLEWVKVEKNSDIPASKNENINLALKAVEIAFPEFSKITDSKELFNLNLPGRLEKRQFNGMTYLLDSAHNQISLSNLNAEIKKISSQIDLCIGLAEGRDTKQLLQYVLLENVNLFLSYLPGERPGVSVDDLKNEVSDLEYTKPISTINNRVELREWLKVKSKNLKVVTGSFYIVGEVAGILEEEALI